MKSSRYREYVSVEAWEAALVIEMGAEFAARADPYRRELLAHCYRMLGSVHDAEDLVQDTMLRAWRAYGSFDEARASLRTWLYRIATNVCLTALAGRARRPMPSGLGTPTFDPQEPFAPGFEVPWMQPIPDSFVDDSASLRLAFVAALQLLPPRQRAVLVMREVLDASASEVAEALDMTPAAVNSALQRARATVASARPSADEIVEPADARAKVDAYVTAFERADLAGLKRLLTEDVVLEMPPYLNWFAGADDYIRFIARAYALRGTDWRMLPASANGQPAVAAYASGKLHTLQVFTPTRAGIAHTVVFQDPVIFALFNLPETPPGQ